jgi:N-acetylmuramic acid 6-phosphate etherase
MSGESDSKNSGAALPPTERRIAASSAFETLTPLEMVRLMNEEDARVAGAVAREADVIARAIELAARSLENEGRLLYAGAGTSGRLGILDAAECPPTFGVPPGRVIGLIAGGEAAVRQSVEGAEDDVHAARTDLAALEPALNEKDVMVGITASGTTPYVLAALEEARKLGAETALLCCDPSRKETAPLVIALDTGPEVLQGSTRLKAGTGIKMVLNMISTGAMARSGRVFEGKMVCMRPVNRKLRARARRIVSALTGRDETGAADLLDEAGGRIDVAVLMARRALDAEEARRRLDAAGGSLRAALEQGEDS